MPDAKKFAYTVFIGRFQPLHKGHEAVIARSFDESEATIVFIGSANRSRSSWQNPFTYEERRHFFKLRYSHELTSRKLMVLPLADRLYNDTAWTADVQNSVSGAVLNHANKSGIRLHGANDFPTALIGFSKDNTSYYLRKFPSWSAINVPSEWGGVSATDLRECYFRRTNGLSDFEVSVPIYKWLMDFRLTPEFRWLVEETIQINRYRGQWSGPFPPVFITADTVVTQSGHILLVRRGGWPGQGLLALPGGFLMKGKTVQETACVELHEETSLADDRGVIPPGVLSSYIDESKTRVFDAPDRDPRGRIVTHAFRFELPDRRPLFEVKGGDDAASAAWHRIGDLQPEEFYADHWGILENMVGL